jgi:antitoxin VapB
VSLNIKDPEVYRYAHALSRATGKTMTYVIKDALKERYERLQKQKEKAPVEELLAIAKRAAAQAKGPQVDHAEFLYDDRGLPK